MAEREDFALRAAQDWAATLPALEATEHELSALIRLSRVAGIQDRIDNQTLRNFQADGVKASDDFRTMALLRRSQSGLTNSQLLEQLGGSKAGISTRLSRLTQHGIVERVPSATDGRSHTNILTTHGRKLADELVTKVVTARKQLTEQRTDRQVHALADMLAQIIDHADRATPDH